MMNNFDWGWGMMNSGWGIGFPIWFGSAFFILIVWSVFWKGLALWHSSRRGEPWWFIALLIINTFGILEILYLFVFAKLGLDDLFRKEERQSSKSAEKVTS